MKKNNKASHIYKRIGIHLIIAFILTSQGCSSSDTDTLNPQSGQDGHTHLPPSSPNTYTQKAPQITQIENVIERPATEYAFSRPLLFQNDLRISYCESTEGMLNTYSGYQDRSLYPIASLSKMVTSVWALARLGADFRFQNEWSLQKVSNDGIYDVYLKSNYDPVMNIEKILFSLAQLKKKGVRKIRQLIIDESTRIYLSVLSQPHISLDEVPVSLDKSIENLKIILNSSNWSAQTNKAKQVLMSEKILTEAEIPDQFSVASVVFRPSEQIQLSNYSERVVVTSSILLKYLKEMNVQSNNYISDALFQMLGGEKSFLRFQQETLKISNEEMIFNTGSGLPIIENGRREDNVASCLSVLRILKSLSEVSKELLIDLGHILLTAGVDQGTFESTTLDLKNKVVLKTGRLYDVPALNVAGVISKNQRKTFFVFMAHDFDNLDEDVMMQKRDRMIDSLIRWTQPDNQFLSLRQNSIYFKDIQ